MKIHRSDLSIARVLSEDKDWVTVEIPKHDDLKFTLAKDEDGETVGGDRFLTLLFVKRDGDGVVVWNPFEEEE